MDPMLDDRLKRIEEKLEKNHQLLVRVRRVQKNAQLAKIFYWGLIILATFGAFYYVQPYINQIMETYSGIQGTQEKIQQYGIPDLKSVNSIIDQLKGISQ